MKLGRSCSFWELYCESGIIIPQIQRDYVQGRKNVRIGKNRKALVQNLISALAKNELLSLNFIYGYFENTQFVPIDGQQRLTTLFLLTYYVFSKCGKPSELFSNGKLRFSYETRYTTDRFLSCLCEHCIDTGKPSDHIKNAPWFSFAWSMDPSVESCLAMLDEISDAFSTDSPWEEYYNRLTRECPIRFMLLELERDLLGKPNQLYIRMNSRGKQLTVFENFKASLYGFIEEQENLELKEQKKAIASKMDADWLEMIWNLPDYSEEDKFAIAEQYADVFFRDLLHWIFVNTACVAGLLEGESIIWLKPDGINIDSTYLENYLDICLGDSKNVREFVKDIDFTLSSLQIIFADQGPLAREQGQLRKSISYKKDARNNYTCGMKEYKTRVLLYAVTTFGKRFKEPWSKNDIGCFKKWFQVVNNLVNNTEIDDPEAFRRSCASISFIEAFSEESIFEWLKNTAKSGFASRQVDEEIFKQSVVRSWPGWEEAILFAEENSYFQGEVLFSFHLLGIKKPEDAKNRQDEFKSCWNTINNVMKFVKEDDNLFHRALLTYDDYSVEAPGGAGNRGVRTYYRYSERHHNYDWRGMLRPSAEAVGAECYKKFLKACKTEDPATVANRLVDDYVTMNSSQRDIKSLLIRYPEMFEYCQNYYYVWHDEGNTPEIGIWNRYCLMRTSRRNAYVEAVAYSEYLDSKAANKEVHEGGNPSNQEERRSWVKINGIIKEYRDTSKLR